MSKQKKEEHMVTIVDKQVESRGNKTMTGDVGMSAEIKMWDADVFTRS